MKEFEKYIKKVDDEIKHHGYTILENFQVKAMITKKFNVTYKKWIVKDGDSLIYYDLIFCQNCKQLFFTGISPRPRQHSNWLRHCKVHPEYCPESELMH